MASVYKRIRPRSGKPDLVTWEARWREANGRQRKKAFVKKSDAERYLTTVEVGLRDGSYVDPSRAKVTVSAYAERWLAGRTRLKPKTVAGYRSLLDTRLLPKWGDVPLGRIHYGDVRDWVVDLSRQLSASRTRQAYFLLTSLLDDAVRDRRLPVNPARGVELPRIPRSERRYLAIEKVEQLASACGGRDALVVWVLALTGIRWGELAGLRVRDVAPDGSRLHIAQAMSEVDGVAVFGPPKTHADRWIDMPEKLCAALLARCEGKGQNDLVFTTERGTPMRVNNWRRACFDRAAAEIGVPDLVPHELRHTAASLAIGSGADPKAVQNMLGHASAAMTLDRYAHLFDTAGVRVAAAINATLPALNLV